MYKSNKVKVEGYHQLRDPDKNWTTNAGWRVSYDGATVGEGVNGTIPLNADSNYITTTKHKGAGGICLAKD